MLLFVYVVHCVGNSVNLPAFADHTDLGSADSVYEKGNVNEPSPVRHRLVNGLESGPFEAAREPTAVQSPAPPPHPSLCPAFTHTNRRTTHHHGNR